MKKRIVLFAAAFSLSCTVAAAEQLQVTVDAQQTAAPISKYLYGGFIEHGGTLMYRSLWSEMLDDRKFYFPITSKDAAAPAPTSNNPFRMPPRKWRPVGPDEVVVMDKDQPFVGSQSPRITLDSSTPHGIRQSGFALVNGKRYTGRIYLRGTPGTKVNVTLIWGDGAGNRQTVSFAAPTREYRSFPSASRRRPIPRMAQSRLPALGPAASTLGRFL